MGTLSWFERWWLSAWPHRLHIRGCVPKFLAASPEPFRGEVLEVGAGAGWTSQQILETYPQVELTATDLDPRATTSFRHLQEKYGHRLKVREADILELPFDRASFDVVIAVHVMHHLADAESAIQQFLRILRPGGMIGIADEERRHHTRRDIERALATEEAEIKVSEGNGHFMVWATKPYQHDTTAAS